MTELYEAPGMPWLRLVKTGAWVEAISRNGHRLMLAIDIERVRDFKHYRHLGWYYNDYQVPKVRVVGCTPPGTMTERELMDVISRLKDEGFFNKISWWDRMREPVC